MKTCEEYELAISCYVDDVLAAPDKAKLFRHLGDCENCRAFLESSIRIRVETAKEERHELITRDAATSREAVPARITLLHRFAELIRSRIAVPIPVAAAVLTLLLGAGAIIFRPQQTKETKHFETSTQVRAVMTMPTIVISQ